MNCRISEDYHLSSDDHFDDELFLVAKWMLWDHSGKNTAKTIRYLSYPHAKIGREASGFCFSSMFHSADEHYIVLYE